MSCLLLRKSINPILIEQYLRPQTRFLGFQLTLASSFCHLQCRSKPEDKKEISRRYTVQTNFHCVKRTLSCFHYLPALQCRLLFSRLQLQLHISAPNYAPHSCQPVFCYTPAPCICFRPNQPASSSRGRVQQGQCTGPGAERHRHTRHWWRGSPNASC